ncbi:MAG: phosphodiester glycosidase family protein, partial [Thermoleophilaceae bacterium]|nr:phosphodiester glycosidase family protein [Thermoleophilaceae bacterium]
VRPARGGPIPAAGSVLAGTGDGAEWLHRHAVAGRTLAVSARISAGREPLSGPVDVINGGPRLLQGGSARITAFAEGFHWPESPEFFYRFGVRRNPRTLAGVRRDGDLVLVAIDGRRPGVSVGASFEESAGVLRALGASDGVNLDGGGSTGMTVGSALVSTPSDSTGERPLGDALVITPR